MRAAIYTRVSLDATGEGLAVTRQEQDARALAQSRGWTVVGVWSDNSISASDATKQRPGYTALAESYQAGEFDALLCWDLDRLTRQPRQLEDWIDAAEHRGLALVTTNGEADLTTDAGRLFARIRLAVARSEVDRKSARLKRAFRQRAEFGAAHGHRLTGYNRDGTLHPDEAPMVRHIFDRFLAGDSLRAITRDLQAAGVPTRSGRPWNPATVRTILGNPRYAGHAVYHGEIVGTSNWDRIVDPAEFDVVTATFADPARKVNRKGTDRRYLGISMFLCDHCGKTIRSTGGRSYQCPGHVSKVRHLVDAYVMDTMVNRLRRDDISTLLADDSDNQAAAHEVERLKVRIAAVDEEYLSDQIDARLHGLKMERLQAELQAARMKLVPQSPALRGIVSAPDPARAFEGAPIMVRRSVIDALCEVRLKNMGTRGRNSFSPDSVIITWRDS